MSGREDGPRRQTLESRPFPLRRPGPNAPPPPKRPGSIVVVDEDSARANIADLAVDRRRAFVAYEDARASWSMLATEGHDAERSARLMGAAHVVYRQADLALAEAIDDMLAEARRAAQP